MKRINFFFGVIFFLSEICAAQTNQTEYLTITTYYPSPYGVYGVLKLNPRPKPAVCSEGEMTYDNDAAAKGLYICDSSGWLRLSGSGGGSYWAENVTTHNIYNTNSGKRVGIGTQNPQMLLDITSTGITGMVFHGNPDAGGALSNNLVLDQSTGKGWDFWTRGPAYPGCSRCGGFAFFNNTLGNGDYADSLNWNSYPITMRPDGRVGINGTVPQSELDVHGVVRANNANGAGLEITETYANLKNYHGGVPAGQPTDINELESTIAACNRKCGKGNGGSYPGLGYHGGTAVEYNAVAGEVTCICF